MAPATGCAVEVNITCQAEFALAALRCRDAVDADIDDCGARLDEVGGDHFRRPTAATRISAPAQTASRSRVREWAMVTVQLCCSSSCAIGLPTMFDRPTTTAFSRKDHQDGPAAEAGSHRACRNKRVLPGGEPSRIHNMEPVDILVRGNGIDHRRFVDLVGKRQLDEDAVDAVVGIEIVDDRQQVGLAGVRSKTMFDRPHPAAVVRSILLRT